MFIIALRELDLFARSLSCAAKRKGGLRSSVTHGFKKGLHIDHPILALLERDERRCEIG